MKVRDAGSQRPARDRQEVLAAILMVAGGRFPSVVVANIPEAARLADDLRAEARRRGVALDVPAGPTASGLEIVAHRR